MENKVIIPGKVDKDKSNPKKYKVKKDKASESDVEIKVTGEGDYDVEKLSVDGLPEKMPDGTPIRWFNNFSIKKNGQVIQEKYFVTIPPLEKSSRLVILDSTGQPYYYKGEIKDNTFELTDGDPGVGTGP
ncbi:hypothetical protein ANAEL_03195 [Anaerolineales bacterium]|nr:hypothetical protein ANAEL_03195 [Anaerolineales bacterium]